MPNSLATGAYLKILKYFEHCKNICKKKNADSGCSMRKTFIKYSIVFLAWVNRMKLVAAPQSYNVSLQGLGKAVILLTIKQVFLHFLKTSKFYYLKEKKIENLFNHFQYI